MAKKLCKAIQFAADASEALILNTLLKVWCERNINKAGGLKHNCYAPVYCVRGDVKMSARRIGDKLTLFKGIASIDLPTAKVTYEMPVPLEEPKPKAKRKTRKAKK